MATAKKTSAKKSTKKVSVSSTAPGIIVTEFGTFTIDSRDTIHQTVYPKSVNAIASMTATEVETLIRGQV